MKFKVVQNWRYSSYNQLWWGFGKEWWKLAPSRPGGKLVWRSWWRRRWSRKWWQSNAGNAISDIGADIGNCTKRRRAGVTSFRYSMVLNFAPRAVIWYYSTHLVPWRIELCRPIRHHEQTSCGMVRQWQSISSEWQLLRGTSWMLRDIMLKMR